MVIASPRDLMVAQQIAARGVRDEAVLEAMREVPRSAFVPIELQEFAHAAPRLAEEHPFATVDR